MQGASGADDKVHCLTSGFSIPMHQVIVRPGLLPFFVDMSSRRSENMGIAYVLLTVDLSPHLFFELLVVWARRHYFLQPFGKSFITEAQYILQPDTLLDVLCFIIFTITFLCTGHS